MTDESQTTASPATAWDCLYWKCREDGVCHGVTYGGCRARHPLNDFADRWELDGDLIRCRRCNRAQQTSWMNHDFSHAAECRTAEAERTPWLTLIGLIQLAKENAL